MNELTEDKILSDLDQINRKKGQIRETLTFVQESRNEYRATRKKRQVRVLVLTLTSAAAIAILGLILFPSFISFDEASEYHKLYEKYQSGAATRDLMQKDPLAQLATKYDQDQFITARSLADSLLRSQPGNDRLLFFLGLTELELDRFDLAAGHFSSVIPQGGSYELLSRWYLALIYLHQEYYPECREQLSVLKTDKNHPNTKKARQLYRKLRFRSER